MCAACKVFSPLDVVECIACETAKPGVVASSAAPTFSFTFGGTPMPSEEKKEEQPSPSSLPQDDHPGVMLGHSLLQSKGQLANAAAPFRLPLLSRLVPPDPRCTL